MLYIVILIVKKISFFFDVSVINSTHFLMLETKTKYSIVLNSMNSESYFNLSFPSRSRTILTCLSRKHPKPGVKIRRKAGSIPKAYKSKNAHYPGLLNLKSSILLNRKVGKVV